MSFWKKLGKKIKKDIQVVGQVGIKVVKYAAPIVGTIVAGPAGGAAGAALSGVAATHRAKNKTKAFLRAGAYGLGATAVVAGGSALLTGALSGASKVVGAAGQPKSILDEANFANAPNVDGGGGSSVLDSAQWFNSPSSAGGGAGSSILGSLGGLAAGGASILGSGMFGARAQSAGEVAQTGLESAGLLPTGTQQAPGYDASAGAGGGGLPPIILIGGAVVLLFMLMRRKS